MYFYNIKLFKSIGSHPRSSHPRSSHPSMYAMQTLVIYMYLKVSQEITQVAVQHLTLS